MPKYLVRLTNEGEPVGVHSRSRAYYDSNYSHWESAGHRVIDGRSETVSWEEFIPHVVSAVSAHHRWDFIVSASHDLEAVLSEARSRVERTGYPDDE